MDLEWIERELKHLVEQNFPDTLAHGIGHVLRVVTLCKQLSKMAVKSGEKLHLENLIIAAYLHDTGRLTTLKPLNKFVPNLDLPHAERSTIFASKILEQPLFSLSPDRIRTINQIIRAHSFSSGTEPQKIEEKILSDADKLDAMGLHGIVRTIAYSVEHKRDLHQTLQHFEEKILLLPKRLYTTYAKKLSNKKNAIVEQFATELRQELGIKPSDSNISSK